MKVPKQKRACDPGDLGERNNGGRGSNVGTWVVQKVPKDLRWRAGWGY